MGKVVEDVLVEDGTRVGAGRRAGTSTSSEVGGSDGVLHVRRATVGLDGCCAGCGLYTQCPKVNLKD